MAIALQGFCTLLSSISGVSLLRGSVGRGPHRRETGPNETLREIAYFQWGSRHASCRTCWGLHVGPPAKVRRHVLATCVCPSSSPRCSGISAMLFLHHTHSPATQIFMLGQGPASHAERAGQLRNPPHQPNYCSAFSITTLHGNTQGGMAHRLRCQWPWHDMQNT